MASNYPTFELGLFDDIQELDNVSEMVETSETSDKSKDQQLSESATAARSATVVENQQLRPMSCNFDSIFSNCSIQNVQVVVSPASPSK